MNADILELSDASLLDWLHSRDECNKWAESTLFILMGRRADISAMHA